MKYLIFPLVIFLIHSCAVKIPYTKEIKDDLSIDTDAEMKRLQFYTSGTLILEQVFTNNKDLKTDENGVVIQNNSKVKEKIIIPANTKCIFDDFGEKDKIMVRFESGKDKTLTFDLKPNNKRYYLDINPNEPGGPIIKYGKNSYKVDLLRSGGSSVYLLIKKDTRQPRSRGRIVRGMKVS
jgi:hypothetical protein